MGDDGDGVAHHDHIGAQFQRLYKADSAFSISFQFDVEDSGGPVSEIFFCQAMTFMPLESYETDVFNVGSIDMAIEKYNKRQQKA